MGIRKVFSVTMKSPLGLILQAVTGKPHDKGPFFTKFKEQVEALSRSEVAFGKVLEIGGHASKDGMKKQYNLLKKELDRRQAGTKALEQELAKGPAKDPDVINWKKQFEGYCKTLQQVSADMLVFYNETMKKEYTGKK